MRASRANASSGTFSILAISPDSKLMGVAVASGSTSVCDRVPHAKPKVGVIATQAYTDITYGIKGLELMANGVSPKETLSKLLEEDVERDLRQVAIMDFENRKVAFTGANVPEYHAEIIGQDYVAIGNTLSRKNVVDKMAEKFESTDGDLAWRIARTLKAGSESGGDKRGEKSAALIIVDAEKVRMIIRIDFHEDPIEELCRRLKSQ